MVAQRAALRPAAPLCLQDLRTAEALLLAMLAEVRAQLHGAAASHLQDRPLLAGSPALDCPPAPVLASAQAGPSEGQQENGCSATSQVCSNSPDALDEWYTDPWAVPGGAAAGSASEPGARQRGAAPSSCSTRSPGQLQRPRHLKNLVEVFELQNDDTATEIEGAGQTVAPLEELAELAGHVANDDASPQWQYGRCVATKLVELSPPGCSAFEQMLAVLLAVFELPPEQQRRVFLSRRAAPPQRAPAKSGKSAGLRCLRGDVEDEGGGGEKAGGGADCPTAVPERPADVRPRLY